MREEGLQSQAKVVQNDGLGSPRAVAVEPQSAFLSAAHLSCMALKVLASQIFTDRHVIKKPSMRVLRMVFNPHVFAIALLCNSE